MQISEPSNTFEITFTIDRTEALKAGKSRWGEVRVTIDPAELDDAERAVLARGVDRLPWTKPAPGTPRLWTSRAPAAPAYAECTPETVRDALAHAAEVIAWYEQEAHREQEERRRQEQERTDRMVAQLLPDAPLSLLRDRYASSGSCTEHEYWELKSLPDTVLEDPRIAPLHEEAKRLMEEHNSQLKAERERRRAEEARKKAEAEARRKGQIDDWVAVWGTESQRARHAVGLLPESEVLDGMRGQVFAPLAQFTRFARLTEREVYNELGADPDYEDLPDVKFTVADATGATAEEYATLERIREAAPQGAVVTLREHIASREDGEVTRKSVRVEITIGEFTFSREYACPQAA